MIFHWQILSFPILLKEGTLSSMYAFTTFVHKQLAIKVLHISGHCSFILCICFCVLCFDLPNYFKRLQPTRMWSKWWWQHSILDINSSLNMSLRLEIKHMTIRTVSGKAWPGGASLGSAIRNLAISMLDFLQHQVNLLKMSVPHKHISRVGAIWIKIGIKISS